MSLVNRSGHVKNIAKNNGSHMEIVLCVCNKVEGRMGENSCIIIRW
jgi:hypothetical protein